MDEQEVDILDYESELREHHNMCALVARSKQVWLLTHARRPDREPDQETLTSIILSGLPSVTDWPCWPANLTVVKQTGGQVLRHLVSPAVVAQHLIDNGHAADLIKCEERGQLVVCGYAAAKVADLLGLDHAPRVAYPSRWNIKTKRDKAYKVLSDAHCTGGVSSSSTGWDMTRDAFEEIWNRASYTHVITLGPEGLRAKAKKAIKTLGPFGLRVRAQKITAAHARRDPAERSAAAKQAARTLGPNGLAARGKRIREVYQQKSPEEKAELVRKQKERLANLGPEKRSEIGRKSTASRNAKGPEFIRAARQKAFETLGPQRRKEIAKKGIQTQGPEGIANRTAKGLATREARGSEWRCAIGAKILETLGEEGIKRRTKAIIAGHAARSNEKKKETGQKVLDTLGKEGIKKRAEASAKSNKETYNRRLIEQYGSVEAGVEAKLKAKQEAIAKRSKKRSERRLVKRYGSVEAGIAARNKSANKPRNVQRRANVAASRHPSTATIERCRVKKVLPRT